MNGWQIGLEYLRVLAWPLVVVFLLWRFKAQAGRLFDRLLSLKTPLGTAEFDRQAHELSIEAEGAMVEEYRREQPARDGETSGTPDPTPSKQAPTATDDRPSEGQPDGTSTEQSVLPPEMLRAWTADEFRVFRDIAALDPASAVSGAWRRIEQFSHVLLSYSGQTEPWQTPATMLRQLQEAGLTTHFVRVAVQLRRLRNSVVHGGGVEVTTTGALDYIDAAERLADALAVLYATRSSPRSAGTVEKEAPGGDDAPGSA